MPIRPKNVGRHASTTIEITPSFLPKGFRTLFPREEVEKSDFRWSGVTKYYVPVVKSRIGDLAGTIHTFIRRM